MRWDVARDVANKLTNIWMKYSFIYFVNRIIHSRKHFFCKRSCCFFWQYLSSTPSEHWKLFGIFSGSSCLVIQVLQTVYFPPEKRKSNTLKKDTTTLLSSLIWFGKMSTVKRLLKTYRQLVDESPYPGIKRVTNVWKMYRRMRPSMAAKNFFWKFWVGEENYEMVKPNVCGMSTTMM